MKKTLIIFIIFSFFPVKSFSRGKILRFDISGSKREVFSLKEACSFGSVKKQVLAHKLDRDRIDCMERELRAQDFCHSRFKLRNNYMRGFLSPNSDQVICQLGESLIFSYACGGAKSDPHCRVSAKTACKTFGENFAKNLSLSYFSMRDGKINCTFSGEMAKREPLDEILPSLF